MTTVFDYVNPYIVESFFDSFLGTNNVAKFQPHETTLRFDEQLGWMILLPKNMYIIADMHSSAVFQLSDVLQFHETESKRISYLNRFLFLPLRGSSEKTTKWEPNVSIGGICSASTIGSCSSQFTKQLQQSRRRSHSVLSTSLIDCCQWQHSLYLKHYQLVFSVPYVSPIYRCLLWYEISDLKLL